MQKLCQLAVFGAISLLCTACSTTPPASGQAGVERQCVEEQSASGSRMTRRICRKVERPIGDETEKASDR